jgi:hypothetical protein
MQIIKSIKTVMLSWIEEFAKTKSKSMVLGSGKKPDANDVKWLV